MAERAGRPGRTPRQRTLSLRTLVCEHAYTGSYRSVQRYVQRRRPPPRLRPIRRVEVRPGSQAQVDWVAPRVYVSELGGWTPLNAFNLSLSFSRMGSVQWRLDQAQLSWLDAHNGAFRAIDGVLWSVRFDNCKTAVASKGGPWAVLNPAYPSYAEQLGFVPDACRIRMPTDKGKTERRVQDVRAGLIRSSDRFDTLGDLQTVCRREQEFREERRVRTGLKLSGLPVGKSHLAAGLGVKAVQNGCSVAFLSADPLIDLVRRDEAADKRRLHRRKYMTTGLLIIDELGFQDLDRRDAHLLFKVISHRYERGSTIITSNKSIREWPDMLAGDEVLATAILDRLLHHCHVIQIDGRSFRLRDMEQKLDER